MNSNNKVDVIVVGAGPAGLACAFTLAKKGLEVVVLERGSFPGAKNMFGGIFFSSWMEKFFPEFLQEAPWERFVAKRRFSLLNAVSETALEMRPAEYSVEPYNHSLIVKRSEVDQWFAKKVEAAGAQIICEYCVKDFIYEGSKIIGISSGGEEDRLLADVVVCAEGANTILTEKAGLRQKTDTSFRSIAVKENIKLSTEIINERFGLAGKEGAAYEFFGASVDGMLGNGFIYTNQDSLSVGVGFSIDDFLRRGGFQNPNDILDEFKAHPAVAPLIKCGDTFEYMTHMIPCEKFTRMPKVYRDGLLIVGDAAGFVNNSFLHEGVNLAMASGVIAAETILEAAAKKDFSANALKPYQKKLEKSFVGQDLRASRNFIPFLSAHPHILKDYPDLVNQVLASYFTVSDKPKRLMKKEIFDKIKQTRTLPGLAMDLWGVVKKLF